MRQKEKRRRRRRRKLQRIGLWALFFFAELVVAAVPAMLLALVLLPVGYAERNYPAIGGEWLAIGAAFIVAYAVIHNFFCNKLEGRRLWKTSLQQQAESCLGTKIKSAEFKEAKAYAERKLDHIIDREGDADGARRQPWYLAQLIAETVRSNHLSHSLHIIMELQAQGTKKDSPCPKTQGRPSFHPYCTITAPKMQ